MRERRGITPDTALRLARYFGGDAESWLNLQQSYDLKARSARARQEDCRRNRATRSRGGLSAPARFW
ncbi:HigA family addiction module antitoxin [Cupriavidus basilensis]